MDKAKSYTFWILALCMAVTLFLSSGSCLLAASEPNPGPVSDSILQQQRDSILFKLNMQYLNGVNDNGTPFELISLIEEILEMDPTLHNHWFNLGLENIKIKEYDRALEALTKGLELYPTYDNPTLARIYISISFCYHETGRYQQEIAVLDTSSQIYPDHPGIVGRYVISAHDRIRFTEAAHYEDQLILILRSEGLNESDIAFYLGRLYLNTDYLTAEKHFRTAYQYDPDNIEKLGALAWVLIQNALKIDEGMALIEQAIEADPNNAIFLHQQGYGYYVKGNYEDALFNLYNARDLYQQYSFELNSHIELVEEAIASLEN